MKLDKETIVLLAICFIIMLAWPKLVSLFIPPTPQPLENTTFNTNENTQSKIADIETDKTLNTQILIKNSNDLSSPEHETENSSKIELQPNLIISNDFSEAIINPNTGGIQSVTLKKILDSDKKNIALIQFTKIGPALGIENKQNWNTKSIITDNSSNEAIVRKYVKTDKYDFEITQKWKYADKYIIDYSFEISNNSNEKITFPQLYVSAGELPPIFHITGDIIGSEYQSIDSCLSENLAIKSKTITKKPFKEHQENPASWIAVTNKYFALVLIPDEPFTDGNTLVSEQFDGKNPKGQDYKYFVLKSSGIISTFSIEPNAKYKRNFKYYSGPKEYGLIKKLAPKTSEIMHFGFRWIEGISQMLLNCLIWLKNYCGTYGMSIIVLTLIVKIIFWPITEKANSSMKKMQKIQPLVQEINVRYKDDPQKKNAKIMQLYKEHKVNPLGGCLPILLQIPVFIALYNTLDGAVELRHSSFLWAHDLSKPDTIFTLPGIELPVNPLILLMTATMILQQKLTPSPADPVQQKMMMFMPLIMLVMLYSLPSGLTLYWTISQLISILQLLYSKRKDKLAIIQTAKT